MRWGDHHPACSFDSSPDVHPPISQMYYWKAASSAWHHYTALHLWSKSGEKKKKKPNRYQYHLRLFICFCSAQHLQPSWWSKVPHISRPIHLCDTGATTSGNTVSLQCFTQPTALCHPTLKMFKNEEKSMRNINIMLSRLKCRAGL